MARKYEFAPNRFAFAFEKCEEQLLIAYYHEIATTIRPGAIWREDYENRFYVTGEGVSLTNLGFINSERKRHHQPEFEVRETVVYDYCRDQDRSWKAKIRCEMREAFLSLDTLEKLKWIETAKDQIGSLLEPHYTHDEFKTMRAANASQVSLSLQERRTRQHVVINHLPKQQPFPRDDLNRFVRLLNLPTKPETLDRIITTIEPDDALLLAESGILENPDILDRLVNRSLE